MKNRDLIPRRRVLGLGVALAGLCAGCAVLPAVLAPMTAGSACRLIVAWAVSGATNSTSDCTETPLSSYFAVRAVKPAPLAFT